MASKKSAFADGNAPESAGACAELEPIRYVERALVSPDGTTVTVKVPVYPPFELASASGGSAEGSGGPETAAEKSDR